MSGLTGAWGTPACNRPDRYLRHSAYLLRIDPITSGAAATDKQDATFHVGY